MSSLFRLAVLPVLIGITSIIFSCGHYRVEYLEESLRHTTRPELIHKFGYPQRLKRLKNGDTVWEYDFHGRRSECASYAITFDADDILRGWTRRDCAPDRTGAINPGDLQTLHRYALSQRFPSLD